MDLNGFTSTVAVEVKKENIFTLIFGLTIPLKEKFCQS